jgi:hypothetical protein
METGRLGGKQVISWAMWFRLAPRHGQQGRALAEEEASKQVRPEAGGMTRAREALLKRAGHERLASEDERRLCRCGQANTQKLGSWKLEKLTIKETFRFILGPWTLIFVLESRNKTIKTKSYLRVSPKDDDAPWLAVATPSA